MTISVFEFSDIDETGSGEPHWDTLTRRRAAQALSNTYLSIGEESGKPVRAFVVSNDDGTTGVRVRIGTAASGTDADQGDIYIAPNSTRTFIIRRKQRDSSKTTDRIYINAVADS